MNGTGRIAMLGLAAVGVLAWWASTSLAEPDYVKTNYQPTLSSQTLRGGPGITTQITQQPGQAPAVLVTDPQNGVLAVYHIDPASGSLTLKSVRNVSWDLKMLEFNSDNPSPQDVRAGLPPH